MTQDKDLKRLIRARMAKTGETYTAARSHILRGGATAPATAKPSPAPALRSRQPAPRVLIRGRRAPFPRQSVRRYNWLPVVFASPAILLFIVTALVGCAPRSSNAQSALGQTISDTELDRVVTSVMESRGIPGAVVGVVHGDRLINRKAFGFQNLDRREPMSPMTLFQIGSVTKVFTTTIAAILAEEGRIDLQHPFIQYLPDDLAIPSSLSGITLAQLATHTAGLPRDPANRRNLPYGPSVMLPYSTAELYEGLRDTRLRTTPGEQWFYSNLGFALLGNVLERVTTTPFASLVRNRILAPLGMNDTGVHPTPEQEARLATPYWDDDVPRVARPRWEFGEVSSFGGLFSSVDDMARFIAAQYHDSASLLAPSVRKTLHEPRVQIASDEWPKMGLGWRVYSLTENRRALVHAGEVDGYGACVAVLPDHRAGYVVLINLGGNAVEELCMELLPVVLGSIER